MPTPRALATYRQTEVQSRSPLELVVLLYDGALKFLHQARHAIEREDIAARREASNRVLAIVAELQSTLDMQKGGEVAERLDALYSYVHERVLQAAADNAVGPIDDAVRVLTPLRDSWHAIATAPPSTLAERGAA